MMAREDFITRFGGAFEHSPWVADRGYDRLDDTDHLKAAAVHSALVGAFRAASFDKRLDVLRAHPDLAGKLAIAELTDSSRNEQAGAGLDRLTPEEHARFSDLNTRYQERFGFPFIIAVKGLGKAEILRAFESRISNDAEQEFETACGQVERIALLRLQALLPET